MSKFKNKTVLLVDTNFSSIPIYEYLVSLGMRVYLMGRNPDDFMAKNIQNYIQIDYSDLKVLKQTISEFKIDYVIPGCNDHSYEICSQLTGEPCRINVDDFETTTTLLNKSKFRHFALLNQLPVPSVFTLESAKQADCSLIVKPVDAFSGKGITQIATPDFSSIQIAIEIAKSHSRNGEVIIEEFVEGQLYSHSAFLNNQKIIQDFIVEEYGSANSFVVDTSFVKINFPNHLLQQVRRCIEKIAQLLNLKDGLIHTQFICNEQKIWLIEITRRCPGDLYSQLIELTTAFPYVANYAMPFIGQPLKKESLNNQTKSIIRHTVTQQETGVFYNLSFQKPLNIARYISISTSGDLLKPSPNGRVGILFAEVNDEEQKMALTNAFLERRVYRVNFIASNETTA
jgi:formate-dependent phosphoribosylglycinamide formyltransferase (GAR transformylase)